MNFVFFFPDELRAESVGCYGNPVVRTPHLDRLAAEGTRFQQCHVQNTVCTPSRCSLFTGLYPHVAGHRTLGHVLQTHEPSLFRYMKKAGYHIEWHGKNHVYTKPYLEEIIGAAATDSVRRPDSGFQSENPFAMDDSRYYSFLYKPVAGDARSTDTWTYVDRATQFLHSEQAHERPFMLYVPITDPHAPYVVPEPYYSMYDPDGLPPLKPTGGDNKPSHHRLIRSCRGLDRIGDNTLETVHSVYLGMVSYVDWAFGRLMQALDDSGLAGNTTVIVASDHGDYAGDYGLVEKWPSGMEDVLTRVPLLIRTPDGAKGHTVNEQVELFDIMPTIMELAGIEVEHDHFAQSLLPQLMGAHGDPNRPVFTEGGYDLRENHCHEGHPQRDAWFAENPESIYWPKGRQQQEHPSSVCRTAMMRTLQYKLIIRSTDTNELYDLTQDPLELNNVYDEPPYSDIRQHMERSLLQWYLETSDCVPR